MTGIGSRWAVTCLTIDGSDRTIFSSGLQAIDRARFGEPDHARTDKTEREAETRIYQRRPRAPIRLNRS